MIRNTKHKKINTLVDGFIDVILTVRKMARICELAMDPNEQLQISQDGNRALQILKVDKNS